MFSKTWSCDVVVAGFLESGRACLANVIVSEYQKSVTFRSANDDTWLAWPVGANEGKAILLKGIRRGRSEGRPLMPTAISLIWYLMQHPAPAYTSIGGGLSVGGCGVEDAHFSWPHVALDGRRFLRGFDVGAFVRPTWPNAQTIEYDESWCAEIERSLLPGEEAEVNQVEGVTGSLDNLAAPTDLFATHDDPSAFEPAAG